MSGTVGTAGGTAAALRTENLGRVYRSPRGMLGQRARVLALDGVCLEVARGELFGLLGPNGAGKTTMVKILTTILLPTSGRAEVLGFDVVRDAARVRPRVGLIFGGERGLYWRLSGRDNLRYFAELYGVPPDRARSRVDELLGLLGLEGRALDRVENYSRGMKQRLHIARGLVHDPEVIFMDEPTLGLDPEAAVEVRGLVRRLKEARKTIFLTTHYLFEADLLCDRVALIHSGRLVAVASPAELKRLVGGQAVVELEAAAFPPGRAGEVAGLEGVEAVESREVEGGQVLEVRLGGGLAGLQSVMAALSDVALRRVGTREPSLEDAYLRIMARQEAGGAASGQAGPVGAGGGAGGGRRGAESTGPAAGGGGR